MPRYINLAPFEPKRNYLLNDLSDVSILIKTLERKEHLINLLASIQDYKFSGPIIIGDDSKEPYGNEVKAKFPRLDIIYLSMPYDTGTALGRNLMLEKVKTSFFVLCDDDFVFDRRTRLPLMKRLLQENQLDILGGVFRQHNRKTRKGIYSIRLNEFLTKIGWVLPAAQFYEYQANFEIETNRIFLKKVVYNEPLTRADLIHNFFIARTAEIKNIGGWNPILKGGEHQNFFIRAKKAELKVGTTRKCGVIHDQWTPNSAEYQSLRDRGNDYQMLALKEFGVSRLDKYSEVLGGKFGV
jgi:glycosyltransferase involved in cell wall biosynthesis